MRLVVQIQTSSSLLRYGSLNLRPFVPLVKGGDGDDIRSHRQRGLQRGLVIASADPVTRVVVVPRPNRSVYITWPGTGHEKQVVSIAEIFDGLPVLMRRAVGKAVGCKIGVHAVEATCEDVVLVTFLNDKADEDPVVRRSSQAVGAALGQ